MSNSIPKKYFMTFAQKERRHRAHLKCFSAVCVVPSIPFSLSAFSSLGSVSSFYPDGSHNNCISPPNSPLATFCRVCLSEVGCHFGSEIKIAELRTLVGSNWDHDESKGTLGYGMCTLRARNCPIRPDPALRTKGTISRPRKGGREGDRMGTSAAGT